MYPKTGLLFLFLPLAFLLASCGITNRYVYRATPVDIPGFTHRGDSYVNVSAGGNMNGITGSGQGGIDVKAAYALSSKWSLTAGYSQRTGRDGGGNDTLLLFGPNPYPNDSCVLQYRNTFWDGGLVFMQQLSNKLYVSFSAGGGWGKYDFQDMGVFHNIPYQSQFNSQTANYYVQGALYAKFRHMDLATGLRYTRIDYTRVSSGYTREELQAFDLNDLEGTTLQMEQLFYMMRFHLWRNLLSLEVQVSYDGTFASNKVLYNVYGVNGSIGLGIDLRALSNYIKKKKRTLN